MPNSFRLCLAFVAITFLSLTLRAQDEPVIKVNPVGRPIGLAKGNAVRYFLWYDAQGWHVRTDSGGKRHVFRGSIAVKGGKVTTIKNFGNLESGKKKKLTDLGVLNKDKNLINFRFSTSIKRDGFDFQVDDSAKELTFKFLIDRKALPQRVLVGRASQAAPTKVLVLPAHPK